MISILLLVLGLAVVQAIADSNNANCTNSITITSQTEADYLSSCDTIAGTITIGSSTTGSITFSKIQKIQGGFTADGVSGLTTLSASNLQTIAGSLTLTHNDDLTSVDFSNLQTVKGGLTVEDNQALNTIGFDDLQEVDGDLSLTGSFNSISLSDLDQAKGKTTIRGSNSFSCANLNSMNSDGVFTGSYSCSNGSNTGLSSGAKAGIAIAVILLVILVLAVAWMLLKRRRKQRALGSASTFTPLAAAAGDVDEEKPKEPEPAVRDVSPNNSPTNANANTPAAAMVIPRKPTRASIPPDPVPVTPSESVVPMLDSENVHEVAAVSSPSVYYELDAGPVSGRHQRPISHA
ncbi:hypothetical protein ASPWEDRAFT_187630 [Aspergillus wentii DTO 134E9]|uniref:Receptor L-domain domain-containing protein n=1 Tax=Aspergillus wentii DTO 134E9 TaxID=1073089 RepID=A0A1L9R5J1_ASPWE|nr:uncharacterized protein ASPWEDRAFT_187630 [Aspergillus wentii DTO 134E9]OJJ30196.1 hypothetical protein ASPWEDRAFT_187630 [Aspergillus wentii DTO 134E9]